MLLCIVLKVLCKVILNRIQEKIDASLRRQQAGFRAGRSCVDHIITLRIILEQVNEFRESLYLVFIDYEKAFERLNHENLWGALRRKGVPDKIVDLIEAQSPQQTESQIDHILIDGRHFSDIFDVRTYRGANIDSNHYVLMVKVRQKCSAANNNLERLKLPEVATDYAQCQMPDEGELTEAPLEDCWNNVKAAINGASEGAIGFVECQTVLDEKNAARARMLHQGTRQNVE
ncbi:uncharacterized protein LOC135712547 [Ochlerotatus camptorhynchus]|uniref:uncharacterized protein LOC135712547 n=1 Tax=Ochlerotatus camptorhynchus TaxID=644619 RepID=UPI0031D4E08A